MPIHEFAPRETVLRSLTADGELAKAVRKSGDSFAEFEAAFRQWAARQTDFLVTVMRTSKKWLMPVGIDVQAIEGDTIEGHEVLNSKVGETRESFRAIACQTALKPS